VLFTNIYNYNLDQNLMIFETSFAGNMAKYGAAVMLVNRSLG
jgi:hypothetical protein